MSARISLDPGLDVLQRRKAPLLEYFPVRMAIKMRACADRERESQKNECIITVDDYKWNDQYFVS